MTARYDLALRSRRTVTPAGERPATVCVTGERIAAVLDHDARLDPAIPVTDLGDLALLPGLVDTHVHVNEPGRTEWEGFATATRAAAAGGVTTIVDMPLNSVPPTVDIAALAAKRAAADGRCHVDVGFWGGAVPGNLAAMRALAAAGVCGFKCFLVDSGVPEFGHLDGAGLTAALGAVDLPVLVHAESPPALRAAPRSVRYADFLGSRPAAAEEAAVATVIEAARASGGRAHIVHLSAASALDRCRAARREGVRLSLETCPHYLALTAEAVPDGGTAFKCCPPIRDSANREALWHALATGGIDLIASDHSPCPPALKESAGDFAAAWGGIASLQLSLPVVWSQARRRGHRLAELVRWMAAAPAELAGLGAKGRIAAGADADLVAFAPEEEFVVEPARLHHRHPVTPYAAAVLRGVVHTTWLRGRVVAGEPRGRLLSRGE